MQDLPDLVASFKAGRLRLFEDNWKDFTSDAWIFKMISGIDIEFELLPFQFLPPRAIDFNEEECAIIDAEINKFLDKDIIVEACHCDGEYLSNIFIRPKKDGGHRVILNLKKLNEYVVKRHFKMHTLQTAIDLMTPGCYMASIDWKDAYYSVPVNEHFRKYLRFTWRDRLYEFTCLPNGLSSGPRIFTKITKPIFSDLRKKGHLNSS